jgi:hypothetical protein
MTRKELLPVALVAVVAGWGGGMFSGILFKSELGMAQEPAPPVNMAGTEEIRIIGKDGTVRAVLGTRDDGATSLAFYDGKGKVRAEMGINAAGVAESALYDQEGKQRKPRGFIYMHVPPTSGPRLSLIGEAANLTIASEGLAGYATLKIEPDNNPVLSLEGEDKGAALLTMLQDGSPSFTLYDPEGYRRAALEIKEMRAPGKEPAPKSTLTLYDKNEKIIWSAP